MLISAEQKFYLLINSKLLVSTVVFLLWLAEYEIFFAYEYENANMSRHFHTYQQRKYHAQLKWARNKFYNLGARPWTGVRHISYGCFDNSGNILMSYDALVRDVLSFYTLLKLKKKKKKKNMAVYPYTWMSPTVGLNIFYFQKCT